MSNEMELARVGRNEYFREWRRKNPEKVKKANQKYWAKYAQRKAEEIARDEEAEHAEATREE